MAMLYFQLVIMAGTVLLAYYFECTDTFQVHIQGFFCQDGDLMKPYPGTEDESFITPLVLYCVLAATPTAIVSPEAEPSLWLCFQPISPVCFFSSSLHSWANTRTVLVFSHKLPMRSHKFLSFRGGTCFGHLN